MMIQTSVSQAFQRFVIHESTMVFNGGCEIDTFPFSFKDKANMWFNSLPDDLISTWEEIGSNF